MKKALWCVQVVLIAGLFAFPVPANQRLVAFDDGIGVIPLRSGPALNVVQGVNPAGIPLVIADLRADVRVDSRIQVNGRGVLLAGGNGIGTTGGQSVRARLFCGGVPHDSGAVPLEPNGDFRIDDGLTPLPPDPCVGPVLLILNGGDTVWFAAGIPKN